MNRDLSSRLVVGLADSWPTAGEVAWLAQWQPAGVILFSRNIKNYSTLQSLCRYLHQLVPDLEIMADHEGGPVSQLARAVGRPPGSWGLGVLDDVGLTARVFENTGRRLSQVGIDRVLAPVADALTEPRNPVIGARSFGSDRALVSRHTVAAVTGLLGAGMKVCLKHWPGHGGSLNDSHLAETPLGAGAVPVPFESGLTAGAGAVMVGHLLPAQGAENGSGLPATLDPGFLADSRRMLESGSVENLLFFADDITMGALGPAMERLGVAVPETEPSGLFDPGSLPVAWFEKLVAAGCERLLIRGLPTAAFPLAGDPGDPIFDLDQETIPVPDFHDGPYAEARQRLWNQAGDVFWDPSADLLWRDFSRHDRWEAAAGQDTTAGGEGVLEVLHKRLIKSFRSVTANLDLDPATGPRNRLLVTSHRPLPADQDLFPGVGERGVCLAMGHPSLQRDLEGRLGRRWRVGALYDIAPEDLIQGPRKPEH